MGQVCPGAVALTEAGEWTVTEGERCVHGVPQEGERVPGGRT